MNWSIGKDVVLNKFKILSEHFPERDGGEPLNLSKQLVFESSSPICEYKTNGHDRDGE
jgi:hypothetical protein